MQRGYFYCIVDEVDSILIDEARTPLIISGPGERAAKTYYDFARLARRLKPGEDADYEVDEKKQTVAITEDGLVKVERELGVENIYEDLSGQLVNHLMQALRAASLFKRDVDYLVTDGEVKIIDEFTGRILEGRRYSEGLHQAIEAKEGVKIKEENQTLATITLQNYFRMYDKIAGMTGTAATEADEFREIYGMEVVVIPTNEPMIRDDRNDLIFKTEKAKYQAAVDVIVDCYERKQPILVGTISVEQSEHLSDMLKRRGVVHEVLNARQHAKEATIVANAGQAGAVTIATNMAGRGTDIKLGEGVVEVGGLFVLGTERHEARRVDNQLRGRSGRQGDPGVSQFIISLEDDLLRIFGGERIHRLMDRLGVDDDIPIEHSLISRSVESAQKKVEEQNFQIRKRVLEYDDVMNKQREVIYGQRAAHPWRRGPSRRRHTRSSSGCCDQQVSTFTGQSHFSEEWDLDELIVLLKNFYPSNITVESLGDPEDLDSESLADMVVEEAIAVHEERETQVRGGGDARAREMGAAPHHRRQVAGPPLRDGLSARGHRPPGPGPDGSAGGVQERGLQHVPGDDGVRPGGLRPLSVPHGDRSRRGARAEVRPGSLPIRAAVTAASPRTSPRRVRPRSRGRAWSWTLRPRRTRRPSRPPARWSPREASPRSGATTPAPAAAARNTRSAAELERQAPAGGASDPRTLRHAAGLGRQWLTRKCTCRGRLTLPPWNADASLGYTCATHG